jgi:hypothetical protein
VRDFHFARSGAQVTCPPSEDRGLGGQAVGAGGLAGAVSGRLFVCIALWRAHREWCRRWSDGGALERPETVSGLCRGAQSGFARVLESWSERRSALGWRGGDRHIARQVCVFARAYVSMDHGTDSRRCVCGAPRGSRTCRLRRRCAAVAAVRAAVHSLGPVCERVWRVGLAQASPFTSWIVKEYEYFCILVSVSAQWSEGDRAERRENRHGCVMHICVMRREARVPSLSSDFRSNFASIHPRCRWPFGVASCVLVLLILAGFGSCDVYWSPVLNLRDAWDAKGVHGSWGGHTHSVGGLQCMLDVLRYT